MVRSVVSTNDEDVWLEYNIQKTILRTTRWIFHKMHLPVISNPTCDTCVGLVWLYVAILFFNISTAQL